MYDVYVGVEIRRARKKSAMFRSAYKKDTKTNKKYARIECSRCRWFKEYVLICWSNVLMTHQWWVLHLMIFDIYCTAELSVGHLSTIKSRLSFNEYCCSFTLCVKTKNKIISILQHCKNWPYNYYTISVTIIKKNILYQLISFPGCPRFLKEVEYLPNESN